MSNSPYDDLFNRNQFILGTSFVDKFNNWNKLKINNSIFITVHPNLNLYHATCKNRSITLLGYILDPNFPKDNDEKIIERLIRESKDNESVIRGTYKYGGRWIIITKDNTDIRLFNDAVGLRQVFYTDINKSSNLWCASQPGTIAELLNLEMDLEAVRFINAYSKTDKEYWWPGDSSPYSQINHMLPNHYLDLKTGHCHRYWPDNNYNIIPMRKGVNRASELLKGVMESANNRYDLAIAITAGWDSRLVLASAKGISNGISYFTTKERGISSDDHPDLTVPAVILSQFGLKHDVLETTPGMNDDICNALRRNVPFSHDVWAPDFRAELAYNKQKKVAVTGSVSEVARNFYGMPGNYEQISGEILSNKCGMGNDIFSVGYFDKWLVGTNNNIYNYNILDIFYWEQRCGNWLSMCLLEADIAWKDIFTPYNCRELLISMLSVDAKYRIPPKYKLYEKLIMKLWPEIYRFPINPQNKKKIDYYISGKNYIKSRFPRFLINVFTDIIIPRRPVQ
jgi:hypothetical protein